MRTTILVILLSLSASGSARGQEFTTNQNAFFESRIRPVLVEVCGKCHARGTQSKGGLQLSAREHLLSGGDSGPTIVPGDPSNSILLAVLRHDDDAPTAMPPEDQLSDQQIDDFAAWVEMGAPWPTTLPTAQPDDDSAWAFKPVANVEVPPVRDTTWPRSEIDRFILARLEKAELPPAPEASRQVWLRRVTFDLTGLPPTPTEVEAFLTDESNRAYQNVVDRLLASPRYGERWARHWLDLVRYSDTNGLDNDYDKPGAYHYRDYVIQAFNQDLPYDQFVREHIAGDTLAPQRTSLDGSRRLSPLGTGFFWLGEMLNAPAQQKLALATELENRIDVFGKTFLGLTVACARCHDHKFDDISTDDYYALGGILTSSANVQACLDTPQRTSEIETALAASRANRDALNALRESRAFQKLLIESRLDEARNLSAYLMASRPLVASKETKNDRAIREVATTHNINPNTLRQWVEFLRDKERERDEIFAPWVMLIDVPERRFARRASSLARRLTDMRQAIAELEAGLEIFEDFEGDDWTDRWKNEGAAFGSGPRHRMPADMSGVRGKGYASSFETTDSTVGRLTSRKFKVTKRYMTMLVAGGDQRGATCASLIFNSPVLPEPEDVVRIGRNDHVLRREWFNMQPYLGEEVFLEIADSRRGPWGHIVIDEIAFTDLDLLPPEKFSTNEAVLKSLALADSPRALADLYQQLVIETLEETLRAVDAAPVDQNGVVRLDSAALENIRFRMLSDSSPLAHQAPAELLSPSNRLKLAELLAERASIDAHFPESTIGIVTTDVEPKDMKEHTRGDANNLGDEVERGFLHALCDDCRPDALTGSGRLELANWLASANNPLIARVMVNRLWQHHFGAGLVATPDNFGQLGEKPSHPDLLDFLATRFIASGWSVKTMHRLMVLSSAYRQANDVDAVAEEKDSNNRLLHHMPIRQLEAEAVRDAMLAVAGDLNTAMYGPGVRTHFTPYMVGEDVPPRSGPLDGDRRRSIYLEVRSNHLMALLEAFHMPKPATTVGKRDSSVTSPMALSMMNNDFVVQQSEVWADRVRSEYPENPQGRIARMILEVYSRPATADELRTLTEFVSKQTERYRRLDHDHVDPQRRAWSDLAQILFCLSEFSFVR